MIRILKIIFFAIIIKPVVLIILGLNIRGKNNLPLQGPAILAGNHNSHLDTMVLMSLYPLSIIHKVRPVAAADYFLANRFIAWFSLNILGIIPLVRGGRMSKQELFKDCHAALDNGDILIIFPEGSRGEPEELSKLKKGVYHLIKDRTDTTLTPVMMHGLGLSLPRGEALLVPFNCDVIIAEPFDNFSSADDFVNKLTAIFYSLLQYCITRHEEDDDIS